MKNRDRGETRIVNLATRVAALVIVFGLACEPAPRAVLPIGHVHELTEADTAATTTTTPAAKDGGS